MARIGNAWHIPRNAEPPGAASMRLPIDDILAGTEVRLISGNQFQGGGAAGNQTQAASALLFKKSGDTSWNPLPVALAEAIGNNKYFSAILPANTFHGGDVVQYYFKIAYSDRDTTFVHGSDGRSSATGDEAKAQADPFTFGVAFLPVPTGNFLSVDSGAVQARIYADSGHIQAAGPDLAGAAHANVTTIAPPAATVADRTFRIGRVISSNPVPNGLEVKQAFGLTQIKARLSFAAEGVLRYEVLDWGGPLPSVSTISAPSDGTEHFYGFGEKYNGLDQSGRTVDILTFDNPANKGDRSYKVAPWFVSTRGYGFHLDSTAQSTFDMRKSKAERWVVTNRLRSLRFHLVCGPKLTDVISRYTGLTGRPPLPPPWAFGPWISSDIWRNGGEVRYAASKFKERRIAVSAFVFDSPWEVAYNDFTFNQTQFAQAGQFEGEQFEGFQSVSEMMTFLRDHGLKAICWMAPFVNVTSDNEEVAGQNLGKARNYKEGATRNFFVRSSPNGPPLVVKWWKGRGSPIDFTKPEARDWLSGQLRNLIASSQVATKTGTEPAIGGFKPDDGESGNGPNTYIPPTAVYADGHTGRDFVNGYCVEYLRTVYSVVRAAGLIFARSGSTGSQASPGCWAGDNEPNFGAENGLPSVIIAGLSAAMSGFSIWGHDVGAYQNSNFSPVSPSDLFMRWAQFGCFSPIMQMHRQVSNTNLRQYPWGYPEPGETTDSNRALANYQFYTRLHTRLFPYLYTYAKQSADTGIPIILPLVLMHQDDVKSFDIEQSYYFGRDLLVAPIIEPQVTQRTVYLPEGNWLDFWTNEAHAGKQEITWSNPAQPGVPGSKIPVFVRRGAILPLILGEDTASLCDTNYVNNPAVKTFEGGLEIRIYPEGASQLILYDGSEIHSDTAPNASVTFTAVKAQPILLRILAARPASVQRNAAPLPEIGGQAAFDAAGAAWRFDSATGFVLVKFAHGGGETKISL